MGRLKTAPEYFASPVVESGPERRVALEVRGLSKRYRLTGNKPGPSGKDRNGKVPSSHRHFWALKDVSFTLHAGERLAIIGQNGAGKSTLLKILSRVINPTSGEAFLYGRVASLLEVGTGFNENLTGRQNIFMNAALHGMTRSEIDAKLDAIIDFSEIGQFVDEPVKTYSTGMRSRLGFSVAAHIDPDILMLDEVLSVGDAAFQQKCLNRMDDLTGNGRTLIFVSHSIGAVRRFCDRAIWLSKGEVVMDGDVRSVCDAYETSTMNITATYQAPVHTRERPKADPARGRKSGLFEDTGAGGEAVVLVSAKVTDAAGQPARSVKINEPVRIEVQFDVLKPNLRIEPALHFMNEKGEMLFVVAYTDPTKPEAINEPGRYTAVAHVPDNLLNEGLHFVTVALSTADPLVRHQTVERAVSFSVYEIIGETTKAARGRYARAFPGGLRPRFEWTTSGSAG